MLQMFRAFALEDAFARRISRAHHQSEYRIKQVTDVIEDRNIVAVTLTGSEPAGRSVASIAGQNLKKTVMELGGSDAYIILDDAFTEQAKRYGYFGRLQNNGQTCIAAKKVCT
jgi:succinate-semialdehyde dehydrogenase/glutarate-semialdehyde dehydrogenase